MKIGDDYIDDNGVVLRAVLLHHDYPNTSCNACELHRYNRDRVRHNGDCGYVCNRVKIPPELDEDAAAKRYQATALVKVEDLPRFALEGWLA